MTTSKTFQDAAGDNWVVTEQSGKVTKEMIESAIDYGAARFVKQNTWTESNESGETGSVTVHRASLL